MIAGMRKLIRAGRGRNIDHLANALFKLVEAQRPVVQGRGQAEAVINQGLLTRAIAVKHAADLRHPDVRLVDDQQVIVGKIIEQVGRRHPGGLAGEVTAVILDAVAVAEFGDHFQVEQGPLLQTLSLNQPILRLQFN